MWLSQGSRLSSEHPSLGCHLQSLLPNRHPCCSGSIPTIPTGVHVITLTYNNVKYSTTLNILTGSTTGVTTLSSASRTGGHIQDVAYQTYTTPKRIIDYNSLTITTNDSLSVSVNNPPAYILTVLDALDTKTYTVNFRINTTTGALEITST